MAQQPYPTNGPPETYSVPDVGSSFDATGLATEAGPVNAIPMPGGGHPAAYSGLTRGAEQSGEQNPPATYER